MLYTVLLNFVATNRTTTNSSYVYFPQKKNRVRDGEKTAAYLCIDVIDKPKPTFTTKMLDISFIQMNGRLQWIEKIYTQFFFVR